MLAGRLLIAQTLVLLTGTITAWLSVGAVGPTLFHNHLAEANVGTTASQIGHTEMAFQSANAISLSLALLAALLVAMAVNVSAADSIAAAYQDKGVRLVTDVAPGLPQLSLDPERMGQVLGNLLENALRHTPTDGRVRHRPGRRRSRRERRTQP